MSIKLVPLPDDLDPALVAAREALAASEVDRTYMAAHRELRAAEDDLRAAKARVAAAKGAFYPAREAWIASPEVAALNAAYVAALDRAGVRR